MAVLSFCTKMYVQPLGNKANGNHIAICIHLVHLVDVKTEVHCEVVCLATSNPAILSCALCALTIHTMRKSIVVSDETVVTGQQSIRKPRYISLW